MSRHRGPSALACLFTLLLPCAACATILDFEEARDRPTVAEVEGGPEAKLVADAASEDAAAGSADAAGLADGAPGTVELASTCTASCLPAVPDGWQGPLAMHAGAGAASPDACGGDYSVGVYEGRSQPVAPAAACACSCAAPVGVSCGAPKAAFFKDANCQQTCGTVTSQSLATGACTTIAPDACYGKSARYTLSPGTPSGGSCAPVATSAVAAARWSASVRLCATKAVTAGTCGTGQICAPVPSSPNERNHCITRTGDWACPAAYPDRQVFHESAIDSRACSACSCGGPAGTACNATVKTYDGLSLGCLGLASTASLPSACGAIDITRASVTVAPPSGGACTPMGGVATGSFTPTSPTTVCCLEAP